MSKIKLVIAMIIFGTIGLFVKYIPFGSSIIALIRGIIGALFLIMVVIISRKKISRIAIKKNIILLMLSGAAIGINWILLFESYKYTTIATATLCYYLAPVFVIIMSPFVFKEKVSIKQMICVGISLLGMVLISGILDGGQAYGTNARGIILGIGAALFYASVIIINKFLKDIDAYESTIVQLSIASAVILPYAFLTESISKSSINTTVVIMVLIVGILHTGVAYWLYFSSISGLKAQTVAIFSYIDPVVAILLSIIILEEKMSCYGVIGAVMILGATYWYNRNN